MATAAQITAAQRPSDKIATTIKDGKIASREETTGSPRGRMRRQS
jgi:hypothetical protein